MKGLVLLVGGHKTKSAIGAIAASTSGGRFVPKVSETSHSFGAVLADLMSIRPGDLVFFFLRRGLYGVCRVAGHPDHPGVGAWVDKKGRIGIEMDHGWKPFKNPLDMDEVLMRPGSEVAEGIRMMGGKSFFQLDPDEAAWLEEQFHRRRSSPDLFDLGAKRSHLRKMLASGELLPLSISLPSFARRLPKSSKGKFAAESVLHAAVLELLRDGETLAPSFADDLESISLHHEYPASPAKQASYVDRIDVTRVYGAKLAPSRYVVVAYDCWEIKTGPLSEASFRDVVSQVMKYADFIAASKLAGDYSRVSMRIVAKRFPPGVVREKVLREIAVRRFQQGVRATARTSEWREVHCLTYAWTEGSLVLSPAE